MATKKTIDEKIDALTQLVTERFASAAENNAKRDTKFDKFDKRFNRLEAMMEKGFAAIAEDLALRPTTAAMTMLFDDRLFPLSRELASIRHDLGELAAKLHDVTGFAKDIDHALERIAAIEKHLGISHKIAA